MAGNHNIYTKLKLDDSQYKRGLKGARRSTSVFKNQLRQLGSVAILDSTAVSATTNTITLDGEASSVDGIYDPALIVIIGGTGIGQSRQILSYDGPSKTATVDRDWKTIPDNTSEYIIYADAGRGHTNEGLLQAATSTTATLNTSAPSGDDSIAGQTLFISSGTGADQSKPVASYNGTTKVVTIEGTWATTPDATSAYVLLPARVHTREEIASAVDTTLSASHGAGSWEPISSGSGPITWTVTVMSGGLAVPGAKVRYSKTGVAYQATTDVNGQATFNLTAADWTVAISAEGLSFAGATVSVATDDDTTVHEMASLALPVSDPGRTTVYGTVISKTGANVQGAVMTLQLLSTELSGVVGTDTEVTTDTAADGTETTFSSDNYTVDTDSEPGRVVLGYEKVWPTATLHHDEYPIEITYVAGYANAAAVPQSIKTAMLFIIERLYDRPPEPYLGTIERAIDSLLSAYKVWGF